MSDMSVSQYVPTMDPSDDLPSYLDSQAAALEEEQQQARGHPTNTLLTTHKSSLITSSGHQWLILRTATRPRQPASLPIFWEGDVISGSVILDLKEGSSENIKCVLVSLTGTLTPGKLPQTTFLQRTETLWESSTAKAAKIGGQYTWTFRFALPKDGIEVNGSRYSLPPSFSLVPDPGCVEYKIVVTLKRGSFARPSRSLSTSFGYIPLSFAGPPSLQRQMSYTEGAPVPGPEEDPEGWKVLPTVTIKGTITKSRQPAEVEISLAVVSPTSYAIGSPIPVSMSLKSQNEQALDLLATPSIIKLQLMRVMVTGTGATADHFDSTGKNTNSKDRGKAHFIDTDILACWWAEEPGILPGGPGNDRDSANRRTLRGELDLAVTLKPTFIFPECSFRYLLVLMPLMAPGWQNVPPSGNNKLHELLHESVTITTRQANGCPKARSDAPPGYDKGQGSKHNRAVGMLGKQGGYL